MPAATGFPWASAPSWRQVLQAAATGRPGWIRVARRGAFAYPDAIAAAAVVSSADLGHHRVPV
ncbi:hypothetical protein C7T86_14455 [Xanthomonas citri pv. malvacearum]|uniref:Uncharacterized protein n=1 Tax=Xanthomonas campestris pv. malvacearum TaxID=86040 RepID=A0AA44Z0E9_XANCM|nr:hypothetical protein CIW71_14715 [Xanthomonas citri pv. malvacearum]ASY89251.1 hypothetical protein CIW72_13695 [Xanthomonas citri pv. malvacearum]NMI14659.1 hypothetical protein [Xanthomonas citri]PUE92502.1 hypothetical protein C7T86_14455 [Xanthomonas citri pv. malvacearum]